MKRLLALALCGMMAIGLVACGDSAANGKTDFSSQADHNDGFAGYYDVSPDALESNYAASVGITMNLENQEWNTFLNTRKAGDYSIARNGWLCE